jgi:hypothetical protein
LGQHDAANEQHDQRGDGGLENREDQERRNERGDEAAGDPERKRRSDDERSVEISLTQTGQELKARVSDIPQLIVDAYNLDANDFAALRTTLRELTESVVHSTDDGHNPDDDQ